MSLAGETVFIAGGTSGIGLAVARHAIERGAKAVIAGRSADKRNAAVSALGGGARAVAMDVNNDDSVIAAFTEAGEVDHVVCTAPGTPVGVLADLETETAQAGFNAKFWGAFGVAKYAQFGDGGTLTLLSGQMARRPRAGILLGGCINAAVEALARGLAAELAPVRVNAVSPGLIDTPLHARLSDEQRRATYKNAAERLPVHRVGDADEIATMIIEIMQNGFITGTVIEVDGGAMVV